MVKPQNAVIGFTSLILGLLSVPIIYIYSFQWENNPCLQIPYLPGPVLGSSAAVILLGGLLAAAAVSGFVAGFWQIRRLAGLYFSTTLVPLALLALLVGFVFMATLKVSGEDRLSVAPTAYRLGDFPGWLRGRVESPEKWERIKGCLETTNLCAELEQIYRIPQDFLNARLSPSQGGCCKPPTECGYAYGGPTYWTMPNNTAAGMDCLQWSNNQTQLCYACDSCKAGLLANLAAEWRRKDYFLFGIFCGSAILYLVGLCAFLSKGNANAHEK